MSPALIGPRYAIGRSISAINSMRPGCFLKAVRLLIPRDERCVNASWSGKPFSRFFASVVAFTEHLLSPIQAANVLSFPEGR
jgi:hypothetical protein